ncbi:unnamed protein product [Leuciscus chuanchicus]
MSQTLPMSFSLLEREKEREGDIYACPAFLPVPFKQAAVRWAGLAMLPAGWQSLARGLRSGCALMNCRHDAGRQPARRTTKRPSGPISVYLCEGEIVKTALTT